MIEIGSLHLYPVKSCRGMAVAEVELGPRGFLHDREFLVVDEADRFLTQRTAPELATVQVTSTAATFVLSAPGAGELRVSVHPQADGRAVYRRVTIFHDGVVAEDAGDEAATWFSAVLHRRCRLVRCGAGYSREIPLHRVTCPTPLNPRPAISFADAFPILMISEASLADLNQRLAAPIPMDRFRPNLVVRGGGAYQEDGWSKMQSNGATLQGGPPCERCLITTIDQMTGIRTGPEPLKTLAGYRATPGGSGVRFGRYFVQAGGGRLRVGDGLHTHS